MSTEELTVEESVAQSLDNYTLAGRLAYMASRGRSQAFTKAQRDAYVIEAAHRLVPTDDPLEIAQSMFPSGF